MDDNGTSEGQGIGGAAGAKGSWSLLPWLSSFTGVVLIGTENRNFFCFCFFPSSFLPVVYYLQTFTASQVHGSVGNAVCRLPEAASQSRA